MDSSEDAPLSDSAVRRRRGGDEIEVAAATHAGRRATNADAFVIDEAAGLFAVADGIGDTPRSRAVASMALESVRELFVAPWPALPPGRCPLLAAERMHLGVGMAHGRLYAPDRPRERRVGTTFAGMAVCTGGLLCIGHVGDSRAYLLGRDDGELMRITLDHTVLGDALCRGERFSDAVLLPDAQALTRAIGARAHVEAELTVRHWRPGDLVLLCTDGVSDRVEPEALATLLRDAGDLGVAAQQLVNRATERGMDNATAVIARRRR